MSRSTFACWRARSSRRKPFPAADMRSSGLSSRPRSIGRSGEHAALDTTVEICGVLVGSWHRDEAGPFVKIVESIRGEGAETRFAEVTFTHQTWAKINAEMDTKFANLSIVGWYHTHPDFGIFLSDRDRFIHEHFFSGPGQIAHVIDPIREDRRGLRLARRQAESSEHFWVGDRILAQTASAARTMRPSRASARPRIRPRAVGSGGDRTRPKRRWGRAERQGRPAACFPGLRRLLMYGGRLLAGLPSGDYLFGMGTSDGSWRRAGQQRVCGRAAGWDLPMSSTGFAAIWRRSCRSARGVGSKTDKPDEQLAEIRTQLVRRRRTDAAIKAAVREHAGRGRHARTALPR